MTVALTVIIVGYLLVGAAVAGRLLTHRPPPVVPDAPLGVAGTGARRGVQSDR